jgi:hypothetical protein
MYFLRVYKKEIRNLIGEDKKNGGERRSPFGGLRADSSTDELVLSEAEGGQAHRHGVKVRLNAYPFPVYLQFQWIPNHSLQFFEKLIGDFNRILLCDDEEVDDLTHPRLNELEISFQAIGDSPAVAPRIGSLTTPNRFITRGIDHPIFNILDSLFPHESAILVLLTLCDGKLLDPVKRYRELLAIGYR